MKAGTYAAANIRRGLFFALITLMMALFANQNAFSQNKDLVVRIAKLEIDPTQLDAYKMALKEHAEIAVRVEPGVLNYTLYMKKSGLRMSRFLRSMLARMPISSTYKRPTLKGTKAPQKIW
jgi:hypothetical protein